MTDRSVSYYYRNQTMERQNLSATGDGRYGPGVKFGYDASEISRGVWAVLLLGVYLEGCTYITRMDCHALSWIMNLTDATEKLACWRLRLLEFDFDIVHRRGVKHQVIDAVFRILITSADNTELEEEIPVMMVAQRKSHNERRSLLYGIGSRRRN